MTPSDPAVAPDGARRSVGLDANLTLRSAPRADASNKQNAATGTSPSSALPRAKGRIAIAPGVVLWREKFSPTQQKTLRDAVMSRLEQAPLYRPVMPDTGKPFSVEESNFGKLGWVSDKSGYRYQPTHPVTGAAWPDIPQPLLDLWAEINMGPAPDCCLVNFYLGGAKMGLHQDRDEKDVTAAVIGVSLGDSALFRIGGTFTNGKWGRGGKTVSVTLASGDVIAFGGTARLAFHGIDRIKPGTSQLLAGGGRLSLTLRRVSS